MRYHSNSVREIRGHAALIPFHLYFHKKFFNEELPKAIQKILDISSKELIVGLNHVLSHHLSFLQDPKNLKLVLIAMLLKVDKCEPQYLTRVLETLRLKIDEDVIHVLAYLGHDAVLNHILTYSEMNRSEQNHYELLQWAVCGGHASVIQVLKQYLMTHDQKRSIFQFTFFQHSLVDRLILKDNFQLIRLALEYNHMEVLFHLVDMASDNVCGWTPFVAKSDLESICQMQRVICNQQFKQFAGIDQTNFEEMSFLKAVVRAGNQALLCLTLKEISLDIIKKNRLIFLGFDNPRNLDLEQVLMDILGFRGISESKHTNTDAFEYQYTPRIPSCI